MTVGVAKVEACYRSIRNVVIRNIGTDIVPAIVAEVQSLQHWVELHSTTFLMPAPSRTRCHQDVNLLGLHGL